MSEQFISYVKKNDIAKVSQMLDKKEVNINHIDQDKNTALHIATEFGHSDMVKLLIQRGAKLQIKNGNGETAQEIALRKRSVSVLDTMKKFSKVYVKKEVGEPKTEFIRDLDASTWKLLKLIHF
jgi:ankyrin repeat protein